MKYSFLAPVLGGLILLIFNKKIWELQQEKGSQRNGGYLPVVPGEWMFRAVVCACGIIFILFGLRQIVP